MSVVHAVDLIIKKRDGGTLSDQDIRCFIDGVTQDKWPDYQISALLMAMFLRGLTVSETAAMTLAMAQSGAVLDLSSIPGIKVDKHSTGGVADTTTLILAPLVAACSVPVVKMSGRGLGFTGGTIDKLESIPGFRVSLTIDEAIRIARLNGLVVMAQTDQLTPADKKLYALRDVTGSVESIPLIAASIMSKKIACGADAIVLDIKCGKGAFMHDLRQARQLAETMVAIGRQTGKRVIAVITGMDQPLGRKIGNALEVEEAISVLKGETQGDLLDVTLTLGSEMLIAADAAASREQARNQLTRALENGSALERFRMFLSAQGGDTRVVDQPERLTHASHRSVWHANQSGFLAAIETAELGRLFVDLGGGRLAKTDSIDRSAGMVLHARVGDPVSSGQPLVTLQADHQGKLDAVYQRLPDIFTISSKPVSRPPAVIDIIR